MHFCLIICFVSFDDIELYGFGMFRFVFPAFCIYLFISYVSISFCL